MLITSSRGRFGGLFLEVKGGVCSQVRAILDCHGRAANPAVARRLVLMLKRDFQREVLRRL